MVLLIILIDSASYLKVQRAYQIVAFRSSHPKMAAPQVVEGYNAKVSVSSGEAVTLDFVYSATSVIFSKPNLVSYVLWVHLLQFVYFPIFKNFMVAKLL